MLSVWPSNCNIEGMNKTIGIVLIVLGLLGVAYGGLTYTTKEKVVDIGPIDVTRDKKHTLPVPPVVGGLALLGGVVLLVTNKS
jgi:hypothetical protein